MDLSIRTVLISDDNPEDDRRRSDAAARIANEAPGRSATSPPRRGAAIDRMLGRPPLEPKPHRAHAEPRAVADAAPARVLADIPEFDEEEYHCAVADSQQPPSWTFPDPRARPTGRPCSPRRGLDRSRAPGARVDATSAVDVFPDVPFKTLDSALLDLSRTGALSARGDGTYVMVSSSQGVVAAARI